MGSEPILVMAGIVVDAQRMHITKEAWTDFLDRLSRAARRPISEFHSRDFYNGNGPWRGIDGTMRARIIEAVIRWIGDRKHKITFSAVNKERYEAISSTDERLKDLGALWCTAAIHTILSLQKAHMGLSKNKGHTVLIFDNEDREEKRLTECVLEPPSWTDSYYSCTRRQVALDQVVDVPYFVDSRWAALIQVADLIAYILRVHAEIQEGFSDERYPGEGKRMGKWVDSIISNALPRSSRYPVRRRNDTAQLFWDLAPDSLRK
jgi:hypothetical protein